MTALILVINTDYFLFLEVSVLEEGGTFKYKMKII